MTISFKVIIKALYIKARYYWVLFSDKNFKQRHKHIPKKARSFINNNAEIVTLAEKVGISFHVNDEQSLYANIPFGNDRCVKFILDKQECFQLLSEQFVHRNGYNFIFNKSVVVIDIGMNVGDTSLFFAANPFVEKVYSYELMPQIYGRALKNFKLNPEIMNKIEPNNYGLGKDDQEMIIPYFDNFDLGNGTFNDNRKQMFANGSLTACKIKNILSEIQKITTQYPNKSLYLKIDAEGSEYEIIDTIFQSQLDLNICYIAMEYHFGVQNIVNLLKTHNFEVIESFACIDGNVNNKVGNIQAVRQCTE